MELVDCISCGVSIDKASIFCFNCGERIKCPSCKAQLSKGAQYCSDCGTNIKKQQDDHGVKNTVNYRNTSEGIFCDVSLTNEVGKEGIKELIQGLTNNRTPKFKELASTEFAESRDDNKKDEIEEAQIIATEEKKVNSESTFPHINDVEMRVNCTEGEWILIYAFYESDFANKTFTKKSVYDTYMAKRKTPSRLKNFTAHWKSLFSGYFATVNDNTFKFIPDKLDYLKQLISGKIKSKSIQNKSTKKTPEKTNESKEIKKITKRGKSSSTGYTLNNELNLFPKGKDSFKVFFSQYHPKGPENILIMVYYLQKILGISNIDINALYTYFKQIPLEVPNIKSALDNIQHRKGWIDTKNYSDLKITVLGDNHVEFKMQKKQS